MPRKLSTIAPDWWDYTTLDEAVIQDVLNGNAHAAFSSTPTPAFWVADYPDTLYRPLGGDLLLKRVAFGA